MNINELLVYYGFSVNPLTDHELETCRRHGLTDHEVYEIASDVYCGFEFDYSLGIMLDGKQ